MAIASGYGNGFATTSLTSSVLDRLGKRGWAKWVSHALPSFDIIFEVHLRKAYLGLVATNKTTGLGGTLKYDHVEFYEFNGFFLSKSQ